MTNTELGMAIKMHRQRGGISQRSCARYLGCEPCTLSNIEQGKQAPAAPLFLKILGMLVPNFHLILRDLKIKSEQTQGVLFENAKNMSSYKNSREV